jgi:hypothetical protein
MTVDPGCKDIGLEILLHVDTWGSWYTCIMTCKGWYLSSNHYRVKNRRYQLTSFTRSLLSSGVYLNWNYKLLSSNPDIRPYHARKYPEIKFIKSSTTYQNQKPIISYLKPDGCESPCIENAWHSDVRDKIKNWGEIYASEYVIPSVVLDKYETRGGDKWFSRHFKLRGLRPLFRNPNLTLQDLHRLPSQNVDFMDILNGKSGITVDDLIFDPALSPHAIPPCLNSRKITISHVRKMVETNHPFLYLVAISLYTLPKEDSVMDDYYFIVNAFDTGSSQNNRMGAQVSIHTHRMIPREFGRSFVHAFVSCANITIHDIKDIMGSDLSILQCASVNSHISPWDIEALGYPLYFNELASNRKLNADFIRKRFRRDIFSLNISSNLSISIEELLSIDNLYVDIDAVSSRPDITLKHVLSRQDLEWNFSVLSNNEAITIDDIVNNPELPWDMSVLSRGRAE